MTALVACSVPSASAPPVARAAEVEIGLDVRALPAPPSPDGVDFFVLAQGDAIRRLAPPGEVVEIRHVPGWGVLYARFRSRAVCESVTAKYVAAAPRLPVTGDAAAQVDEPCHEL